MKKKYYSIILLVLSEALWFTYYLCALKLDTFNTMEQYNNAEEAFFIFTAVIFGVSSIIIFICALVLIGLIIYEDMK